MKLGLVLCQSQQIPSTWIIFRNPAIKHGTLQVLTHHQKSLTSLDLSSCNRAFMDCSPEAMVAIFRNLAASRIRTLRLYSLSIPRGFDQCIGLLVDLETLNIKCLDTPSRALADGLCNHAKPPGKGQSKSCAKSLHR